MVSMRHSIQEILDHADELAQPFSGAIAGCAEMSYDVEVDDRRRSGEGDDYAEL